MLELPHIRRDVATDRFGPFTFQLGIDAATLELPVVRVDDAHERFVRSPLSV